MKIEKGDIYHIEDNDYIVFYVSEDIIGFIHKDKALFMNQDTNYFIKRVIDGKFVRVMREEVDALPTLPPNEMERCLDLSLIMDKILLELYPEWNTMVKTYQNKVIKQAALQAGYSVKHLRRLLYRYLRSGCDMYSLVDQRHLKLVNMQKKNMNPLVMSKEAVVLLDKEEAMEYALSVFKIKKHIGKAYDEMLIKYFSTITSVMEDGVLQPCVEHNPDSPSYSTVRRYISNNLGGKTIKEYIQGDEETRNNDRFLTGNMRSGIITIGEAGHIDESEFSVSITDGYGRVIGKGVIYGIVDPVADMITGCYVGLYNNYIGGVINTLFGMLEPHENQTKLVGVHCDEYSFPSLYIPKIIYTDRGSEYKSGMMDEAMHELGIKVIPVPGATGSYKGGIENAFQRLQKRLKRELINDGYILTTHDGPTLAKENAVLTIEDYRTMVYRDLIEINTTKLGEEYSPDREMIENGIPPVPAEIWKWKMKTIFNPISITDTNRRKISFCLLWRDRQFTRGRDGIRYKDHKLRYFVEDEWFYEMLKSTQEDKISIRYNETDISHVHVRYKGIVYPPVPLSASRDELRSFIGLSWDAYDEIYKTSKSKEKEQEKKDIDTHLTTVLRNDLTVAISRAADDGIVNDVNSIPEARALERVRIENDPNDVRHRILGTDPMAMRYPKTNYLSNNNSKEDTSALNDPVEKNKYEVLSPDELASLVEDNEE